eukprot:m.41684 g.41684  ORF g.41684 m.41684 type:complete len:698 (+) comp33219_c0_seq5:335-2428(+)
MPRSRPKMGDPSSSSEQLAQTRRSGGGQIAKTRCDDRKVARKGFAQSDGAASRPLVDKRCPSDGKRRKGWHSHSGAGHHQREKRSTPIGQAQANDGLDAVDQLAVLERGGGRKGGPVSLNHLLNFKFAPREAAQAARRQNWHRHSTIYNKEQFLQANCQFVVQQQGDYTVHAVDSDILVNWDLIEQVRMFCYEISSCPICLYPPRAAKITRCGHIFCWPCILHYLSLSDHQWRKCPICHEAVHKKDLKSVKSLANHHFIVGDEISMQLMARKKPSVVVMPISQTQVAPPGGQPFNLADPIASQFEKLLLTSSSQTLQEIVNEEEAELKCLKLELEGEKEDPFFAVEALELLDERKKALPTAPSSVSKSRREEKPEKELKWTGDGKCQDVGDYEAAFSDEGESGEPRLVAKEETASVQEEEEKGPDNSKTKAVGSDGHTYYFYQASDGQHMFIHPVNTKCLVKEYDGLTECPQAVTGKIVEIEWITQTEETRRRYRFLHHLPLTCQFALCEVELKPPTVSKATLQFFYEELQRRKNKRNKKAREEKKREKQLDRAEQQELPPLPSEFKTGPDLKEIDLDPSAAVFIPGADSHGQMSDSPVGNELSPPSFAQALCDGMEKASPSSWPVKTSFRPYNTSFARSENDEDDDPAVPSFQESFTEALTMDRVVLEAAQLSSRKGQKKGRGKQLLFSTGSQRRY